MDYGTAFCEYECNVCSQVCPTAAIMPISLAVKKETQIGQVRFLRDRCVVVTNGTACGACAEVCPTHAVYMVGHKDGLTIPETDVDVCVGCGNCEYACPVLPGKAIYVEGNEVHRRREVKSAEDTVETIDTGESGEFPF
jgi:formate hydrogenlyase subunit 6/NADH:ubiquinone oxidoreductase subunit I